MLRHILSLFEVLCVFCCRFLDVGYAAVM